MLSLLFLSVFAQNVSETQQRILERHNYYRQLQGAPDLRWSDTLTQEAQNWADYIAKKDIMAHSKMEYGENIYMSTEEVSPESPVDTWADEEQFYHGETISNQNYQLFGHYTQLIWAATTYVGCAEAVSKTGKHYWVCEYSPAGNYIGEKPVSNYHKK